MPPEQMSAEQWVATLRRRAANARPEGLVLRWTMVADAPGGPRKLRLDWDFN